MSEIEFVKESSRYSAEQVYRIYQSGAENGYLNQAFYTVPLTDMYVETSFAGWLKRPFKNSLTNPAWWI